MAGLVEELPEELQAHDEEPDYDEDELAPLEDDEPGDQIVLDESTAEFIDQLIKRCILFVE